MAESTYKVYLRNQKGQIKDNCQHLTIGDDANFKSVKQIFGFATHRGRRANMEAGDTVELVNVKTGNRYTCRYNGLGLDCGKEILKSNAGVKITFQLF